MALGELPDEDCVAYDTAIRRSGHCLASDALQPVHTATTVPDGTRWPSLASKVAPYTRR